MAFYSRDQITSILKCTAKYYYGIWSAPIKEDSDFQEYLMRGFELKRKKKNHETSHLSFSNPPISHDTYLCMLNLLQLPSIWFILSFQETYQCRSI